MTALNAQVFINCPFDREYFQCFEALAFTIAVAGYEPVCALQDDDFGDVRLSKLKSMIERCDRSVHDLSRTESSPQGLPRFNMPFELGMTIGALTYGGARQRRKRVLVMVKERYDMAKFLSDAAGQDPQAHDGSPARVITIVRNHLRHYYSPDGVLKALPGPQYLIALFSDFKRDLPKLAAAARLRPEELDPFSGGYMDFVEMLKHFGETTRRAGKL